MTLYDTLLKLAKVQARLDDVRIELNKAQARLDDVRIEREVARQAALDAGATEKDVEETMDLLKPTLAVPVYGEDALN